MSRKFLPIFMEKSYLYIYIQMSNTFFLEIQHNDSMKTYISAMVRKLALPSIVLIRSFRGVEGAVVEIHLKATNLGGKYASDISHLLVADTTMTFLNPFKSQQHRRKIRFLTFPIAWLRIPQWTFFSVQKFSLHPLTAHLGQPVFFIIFS